MSPSIVFISYPLYPCPYQYTHQLFIYLNNNHIINFLTLIFQPSIHLSIHQSIYHPSIHLFIHRSIHPPIHLLTIHHPSFHHSSIIFIIIVCLSSSIYPSIHLSWPPLYHLLAPPTAPYPRRTSNQSTTLPRWTQHS